MARKTRIRLWIATIVIGVLMIPAGVGWIIYTVTQTGRYDPNAEFTDPDTHVTSRGAYVSDSPLPFLGFALSFGGGILITVGSLGLMFGWFSGRDDDDDGYTGTSAAYARSVPTTRVGWGPEAPPGES
jgi:zinc transporter ZupT